MIKINKYETKLNLKDTEIAIKIVKDSFEKNLSRNLNLLRVTAPLFVINSSGLNDDLTGVEQPVSFKVKHDDESLTIIHSLAKWKRMAASRYGLTPGHGLYTDMNAIRKDEALSNIHSIYVDQWDWEQVITMNERTLDYLKKVVTDIYQAIKETQKQLIKFYPNLSNYFPEEIKFITAKDLENMYPNLSAKERENEICRKEKAVFLIGIGEDLDSGKPHDLRAPDYDDWKLNGDILVYYPPLNQAVELSSMGIRVDSNSLITQLTKKNELNKLQFEYHSKLKDNLLPLTIGGGIGQSRLCLIMLNKVHIGEVQSTYWDKETIKYAKDNNIPLL